LRAAFRDPVFEQVLRMQIRERGCRCCARRVELASGDVRCGNGRRFPSCRGQRGGFVLEEDG